MNILEIKNLIHKFIDKDDDGNVIATKDAVDNVSLQVEKGQFIAVLGHNGSGKSTMAKHINALLLPTSGTLYVAGKNTSDEKNVWDVRQSAGMVFQNPDNQIIGSVVEEDVGFGPENLGVPTEDIWKRVEMALKDVGMLEYRKASPARLSGGQKQRVAIAGVLAMKPDCIVLDEPTAMLDPGGRKEVMQTLQELNKKENVTIILITHHMDEALMADNIFVMQNGKLILQGNPKEVFQNYEIIKDAGLDLPTGAGLAYELGKKGVNLSPGIVSKEDFVREFSALWKAQSHLVENPGAEMCIDMRQQKKSVENRKKIFEIRNLTYIYGKDSIYEKQAVNDVSLDIYEGEFLGIIGHTGSGKSTLVQHLNGLNRGGAGEIYFHGENIYQEGYQLSGLRKKVGIVFQYPEYQLFETTVLEDVCFGPKNLGMTIDEVEKAAKWALELTGIGEEYYKLSPFELSGGQKRRVAIAGVLAMLPEVLILDEPTAALDPRGRDEIYAILEKLQKERNMTIIVVSHSMEDMAKYADRMIVMEHGRKCMDDVPEKIFSRYEELEKIGLSAPVITYVMKELKAQGLPVRDDVISEEEAVGELLGIWNGEKTC